MNYSDWNIAIARHFFNVGMGGKDVLLFVNEEKINAIGSFENADTRDFIVALKKEAEFTESHICKRALTLYKNWRDSKSEYPPYIAYLSLFVLASTTEGDFDPKAYYPRLWKLIGSPGEGAPEGFYEMEKLWGDLEKWSIEDKREELGRFRSRIRGKWCHVGRPLSQTLLSEDERKSLPSIFYDCGFDPNNIPSEVIIKSGLKRHGAGRLRHRTLALLENEDQENQEFVNSLLDLVLTELEQWGKLKPVAISHAGDTAKQKQPTVKNQEVPLPALFFRTCLEVYQYKQLVAVSLRLKTDRAFPPKGLRFKVDQKTLVCSATGQGWSTKLMEMPGNKIFDPLSLSWSKDWFFIDTENEWNVAYRNTDIRLFLAGDAEGLPGFLESQKLQRNDDFYIICSNVIAKKVSDWGKKFCNSFSTLDYVGIPSDRTLFKGSGATKSCEGIDVLTLSDLLHIKLEGGIGIGYSNQYLSFAPPKVRVDGGLGNETVLLNGQYLKKLAANIWELPKEPLVGRLLNIQVSRGSELLQESRVIELIEPTVNTQLSGLTPKRDSKGRLIEGDIEDYARGAFVSTHRNKVQQEHFSNLSPDSLGNSLIFIGQFAGQICRRPPNMERKDWTPIWVLKRASRRKWIAYYCGKNLANEAPIKTKDYSIKELKAWKKVLWVMRRRIRPPEHPSLTVLWTKYMEVAKNI